MTNGNLEKSLTALEPKTKVARVREVMSVIEERIAAGVRIADISVCPAPMRVLGMKSSGLYQFW